MAVETVRHSTEVEVLSTSKKYDSSEQVTHVVEVLRTYSEPINTFVERDYVEVVKPGGTVVNVGSGPDFPQNPYEGLIWIKL